MDLELSGRRVVITGASKGIGLACARAFAAEGAKVIGLARSAEGLAQARDALAAGAMRGRCTRSICAMPPRRGKCSTASRPSTVRWTSW